MLKKKIRKLTKVNQRFLLDNFNKKKLKLSKYRLEKLAEALKKSEPKKVVDSEKIKSLLDIKFKQKSEKNKKFSFILQKNRTKENKFIKSSIRINAFSPSLEKTKTFQKSPDLEQVASAFQLQEESGREQRISYSLIPRRDETSAAEDNRTKNEQEQFYFFRQEKKDEKYQTPNIKEIPMQSQTGNKNPMQQEFKHPVHFGESRPIETQEAFREQYKTASKKLYKPYSRPRSVI